MKSLDGILPPPRTNMEDWNRWMNRMAVQFQQAPWSNRTIIEVKEPGDE